MEIKISNEQDITIINMNGDLQRQTTPDIQEEISPLITPGGKILIDLSNVSHISSAGLRYLLLFYRQIEAQDGRVVLTSLQERVKDTMSITGFVEFFDIYDSIEDGISALI